MSIFMNYDGLKGEATDKNHQDWIDVDQLSWGVRRNITSNTATAKDRESANAEITDLTLTRRMDKATPDIFMESCCGKGKDAVIHLCKTGTGSGTDTYMEYTLKNALISHYTVNAGSQSDDRPKESITISFQKVELKYTPYDDDGNAEASVAVGFDTTTNEKA
ncbi:type VI secretion system tube protein Hcp [Aquisalimonas lutea]|uniref:Hcp family type VI secretion system effector n=1 Tax=Aquisalimonas lutea TaxID=1327750 RepID=UPI0025B462DB|nr:type VI secretion system tube protein Hcp [Aquisalimonas lutea]MDN3519573.1 type VI secretion system tube protein Hcp [Aquisalimonas lutea]